MDRFFVRTAAVVFCATWIVGCGSDKAKDSPLQAAPGTDQSGPAPTTLSGAIAAAHMQRVRGEYDAAAKALGQIMLVAPDDPRVVSEYGKALLQQGHAEESVPFLRRAVELKSDDWTAYSALGVAYDQTNDHADAKLAYEHALVLKPGAQPVLNNYAMSRMLAGDLDGARRLMAKVGNSDNPKITANIELLASMRKSSRHEAVFAPVARAVAPAPTVVAHAAPQPPAAKPVAAPVLRTADVGPHVSPKVVMQKVPTDPLAGPVVSHGAKKKPVLAHAAHSKAVKMASVQAQPAAAKPVATAPLRPAATKIADVKPASTKVADVKPASTKVADVKPASTKVADVKPASTKPVSVAQTPTTPSKTAALASFAQVPMLRTADDGK